MSRAGVRARSGQGGQRLGREVAPERLAVRGPLADPGAVGRQGRGEVDADGPGPVEDRYSLFLGRDLVVLRRRIAASYTTRD